MLVACPSFFFASAFLRAYLSAELSLKVVRVVNFARLKYASVPYILYRHSDTSIVVYAAKLLKTTVRGPACLYKRVFTPRACE